MKKLQGVPVSPGIVIHQAHHIFSESIPFGNAQLPEVNDYADNVDTMGFLLSLK